MECTQDIMVLQSAILLANKTSGGLHNVVKNTSPEAQKIITAAAKEALNGVFKDKKATETEELEFRVTTFLLALNLANEDKTQLDEFWFSVLQGMPVISADTLFTTIKECYLNHCLFKILKLMEPTASRCLLDKLVSYINVETDISDLGLLTDLCENTMLLDSPWVFDFIEDGGKHCLNCYTDDEREFCSRLSKLAKTSISSATSVLAGGKSLIPTLLKLIDDNVCQCHSNKDRLVIFMSVANCLAAITGGSAMILSLPDHLRGPLEAFLSTAGTRAGLPPMQARELFLDTQDAPLTKKFIHNAHLKDGPNIVTSSALAISVFCTVAKQLKDEIQELRPYVRQLNESPATQKGKEDIDEKKTSRKPKRQTEKERIVSFYQCRSVLDHLVRSCSDESQMADCQPLLVWCRDLIAVPGPNLYDQLGEKRWDWCQMATKGQLEGHQDLFVGLLKEDISSKVLPRWLKFVETHLSLLNSVDVFKHWLHSVSTIISGDKKAAMVAMTVRMITLAAYRKLPLADQASVVLYAHRHINIELVFGGGSQLQMKLTAAFNRLVKSQGNVPKSGQSAAAAISELMLQSPEHTMQKLVEDAVNNNGMAPLMADILGNLPSLCLLTSKENVPLLQREITHACARDLSHSKEQNFIKFVTCLFTQPPISGVEPLSRVGIVQSVVLPNLNEGGSVPQERALKVLRIAIETSRTAKNFDKACKWLLKCHVVPLVLSLCEIIESQSRQETSVRVDLNLREQLIATIALLVERLTQLMEHFSEKDFTWLYNSLLKMHWTSLLYVAPVFNGCNQEKFPIRIPKALHQLTGTPTNWVTFPYSGADDPIYLLLEAFRVTSPATLALLPGLTSRGLDGQKDIHIRLVAALAMLLPQSLASECEEMLRIVVLIGTNTGFPTRQLLIHQPKAVPEDYEGAIQALFIMNILHDVIIVLRHSLLTTATVEVNLQLAQTYVTLVKSQCVNGSHLDQLTPDVHLTLITECLYRLCHQMAKLDTPWWEPLNVLVLDLLQMHVRARDSATTPEDKLATQIMIMEKALGHCPSERDLLLKTLHQQNCAENKSQ